MLNIFILNLEKYILIKIYLLKNNIFILIKIFNEYLFINLKTKNIKNICRSISSS